MKLQQINIFTLQRVVELTLYLPVGSINPVSQKKKKKKFQNEGSSKKISYGRCVYKSVTKLKFISRKCTEKRIRSV